MLLMGGVAGVGTSIGRGLVEIEGGRGLAEGERYSGGGLVWHCVWWGSWSGICPISGGEICRVITKWTENWDFVGEMPRTRVCEGKIISRGTGAEIPRKGLLQLFPCDGVGAPPPQQASSLLRTLQ